MALEKDLWRWVEAGLKQLRADGLPLDWQRIESATSRGTPDVELCIRGVSTWVELKRKGAKPRPSQIRWHALRARAGGVSFFLIGEPGLAWLVRGCFAANLRRNGLNTTQALRITNVRALVDIVYAVC